MGVPLPDFKVIRAVVPAERDDFPVSLALAPDGSIIVVSRFADDVWDFYPYIVQESLSSSKKLIDWRAGMPDGRPLTDPKHAELLLSAKAFIWSLFADPVEGRRRPTMHTLITRTKVLLFLLRWMVERGIRRFEDMTGNTMAYTQTTKKYLTTGGKEPSAQTIGHRLQILGDIYRQRSKLDDALQANPWPGDTVASLSGFHHNPNKYVPKTELIPERVAVELASVVLDYIRKRSSNILAARDAKEAAMRSKREAGFSHDTIKLARAKAVREWGYANAYKLTTDVGYLRTACMIVIEMFSGIRQSELMSLGEDCISHRQSRDGSFDVTWLHGTTYKMGMRPKAWQVPPVVEEAVAVMMLLTQPLRDAIRREISELHRSIPLAIGREKSRLVRRLALAEHNQNKLFLAQWTNGNNAISVLSGASVYNELRRFCVDHRILGDDGQPYPLHSHQFRRTYARFIARSELGDLLTLRDHLGHWSLDETTFYADGATENFQADVELLKMIAIEKQQRTTEVVHGYLVSDAPLANGEHWLGQWRESVRTASDKEALIAEYAGSITLNGTGHSWCVGNARGTGCGGLCVFEAPMCVDCQYGIIGSEHRAVWEAIRDQQLQVLALDDIGESGQARARKIMEVAETVLRRLDGEVTP